MTFLIDEICDRIRADYQQFPKDQSYDLYAETVYFKDPMNEFRGVARYQKMIGFIDRWFRDPRLEVKDIKTEKPDQITTHWTLFFTAPLPWHPRIKIPGWSELRLNDQGLVVSHIDYWECSKWDVIQQLWT